jgi:colanic acid/amylovoran biosynthesis glycosyltransferase
VERDKVQVYLSIDIPEMKTGLFLFTTHYPYGRSEVFIENEIKYLAACFSTVTIIPLISSGSQEKRDLPANVTTLQPLIGCRLDQKLLLLIKGVFCRAPFLFAVEELFRKKVFTRGKWIMNWLSYTCLTRAAYSSAILKKTLATAGRADPFYFYWADNSASLIPLIRNDYANNMVVRFHGGDLYEERKGGYLPYRDQLLKALDMAVFISEQGRDYLLKRYPWFTGKWIVSRLGVTSPGISKPGSGDRLHLLSCSGLVGVKRVHLIAMALEKIKFRVYWTHFGSGPCLDDLKAIIKDLPQNISVNLMGEVDNSLVLAWYLDHPADLFINVSKSEGLPVSIMEAISVGIPVLATDAGGISEIVSEENGFLMPVDASPGMIAGYISRYHESTGKEQLRDNARRIWMEKFNAQKNFGEFCNIISSLSARQTH